MCVCVLRCIFSPLIGHAKVRRADDDTMCINDCGYQMYGSDMSE